MLHLVVLPLPSPTSIPRHVGLVKQIRHVLYALLPAGGVSVPAGGAVGGRGAVPRGGGLPVDVAA